MARNPSIIEGERGNVSGPHGVRPIAILKSRRLAVLPIAFAIWLTNVANGPAASEDGPMLVEMGPIVVPIVGSGRLEGAMHVKIVVSATDATALARLTQRLPELRAVSVAGAIEFSRLFASTQTPVNAVQLRSALNAALHATDEGVADTLIVEVSAVA